MRRIFDGHLDLSWNALSWDRDITLELDVLNRLEQGLDDHPARGRATTTLPEMRRGGVALCQATLLARAKSGSRIHGGSSRLGLDFANQEIASATARGQLAYYELLERRGLLRMIRTAGDLDAHWTDWAGDGSAAPIGYILAMEGADPIVDVAHAADLVGPRPPLGEPGSLRQEPLRGRNRRRRPAHRRRHRAAQGV